MKSISTLSAMICSLFMSFALAQSAIPTDAKFLDQFSEHHMDGIKMAQMAQKKAQSADLKKMAKKMVNDQSKEVEQMKKWRSELFPSAAKAEMDMPKMDMTKLEKTSGHEFDMAFSEMMTKHHQQGIDMINGVSDELKNSQVKKFAQEAAKNQSEEKDRLEKMAVH